MDNEALDHPNPLHNKFAAVLLWILVILTFSGIIGIAVSIMLEPVPASFQYVFMETPTVRPSKVPIVITKNNGVVRINSMVDNKIDWDCLVSTQFFIDMSDGTTWKLPGTRLSKIGKSVHEAKYMSVVPYGSPPGKAFYYIVDTYGCRLRNNKVMSPKIPFEILDSD